MPEGLQLYADYQREKRKKYNAKRWANKSYRERKKAYDKEYRLKNKDKIREKYRLKKEAQNAKKNN